jgi:hypothetical protein
MENSLYSSSDIDVVTEANEVEHDKSLLENSDAITNEATVTTNSDVSYENGAAAVPMVCPNVQTSYSSYYRDETAAQETWVTDSQRANVAENHLVSQQYEANYDLPIFGQSMETNHIHNYPPVAHNHDIAYDAMYATSSRADLSQRMPNYIPVNDGSGNLVIDMPWPEMQQYAHSSQDFYQHSLPVQYFDPNYGYAAEMDGVCRAMDVEPQQFQSISDEQYGWGVSHHTMTLPYVPPGMVHNFAEVEEESLANVHRRVGLGSEHVSTQYMAQRQKPREKRMQHHSTSPYLENPHPQVVSKRGRGSNRGRYSQKINNMRAMNSRTTTTTAIVQNNEQQKQQQNVVADTVPFPVCAQPVFPKLPPFPFSHELFQDEMRLEKAVPLFIDFLIWENQYIVTNWPYRDYMHSSLMEPIEDEYYFKDVVSKPTIFPETRFKHWLSQIKMRLHDIGPDTNRPLLERLSLRPVANPLRLLTAISPDNAHGQQQQHAPSAHVAQTLATPRPPQRLQQRRFKSNNRRSPAINHESVPNETVSTYQRFEPIVRHMPQVASILPGQSESSSILIGRDHQQGNISLDGSKTRALSANISEDSTLMCVDNEVNNNQNVSVNSNQSLPLGQGQGYEMYNDGSVVFHDPRCYTESPTVYHARYNMSQAPNFGAGSVLSSGGVSEMAYYHSQSQYYSQWDTQSMDIRSDSQFTSASANSQLSDAEPTSAAPWQVHGHNDIHQGQGYQQFNVTSPWPMVFSAYGHQHYWNGEGYVVDTDSNMQNPQQYYDSNYASSAYPSNGDGDANCSSSHTTWNANVGQGQGHEMMRGDVTLTMPAQLLPLDDTGIMEPSADGCHGDPAAATTTTVNATAILDDDRRLVSDVSHEKQRAPATASDGYNSGLDLHLSQARSQASSVGCRNESLDMADSIEQQQHIAMTTGRNTPATAAPSTTAH